VAQVALAWLLYQPVVSTVIVGAKRADQLADNIAAWTLSAGEVFAAGDFPSGSRDSRHFGPLPLTALRYRIR
jgi:aryl-alcohol dehydrogenase-like predicted oxidoreductase